MNSRDNISIAVLPFEDFSENKDSNIFCKSFSADLTTELSFFKQFNIISFQTTQQIVSGSEINFEKLLDWEIEYYVQGSVRNINQHVRVNAQLFEAQHNRLIWAKRYETPVAELMEVHDNLVKEIVASLQLQVNEDLLSQKRISEKVNFKAYECWLHGMNSIKKGTLEGDLEAREYFEKALEIEPAYSLAYSGMSLSYFNEWSCRLWDRWEVSQNGAYEWARKAIQLDDNNYMAALILGRVFLYEGSYESSEYYLRRSLQLNSNDADNLIEIASCFTFLGFSEEARELYQRSLCLNPVGSKIYHAIGAFIHFELGEFERARSIALKSASSQFMDTEAYYAAAYYFLDEKAKMKEHWSKFLTAFKTKISRNVKATNKDAIEWMKRINPYKNTPRIAEFWNYIRGEDSQDMPPEKPRLTVENNTITFRKENEVWEFNFAGSQGFLPAVKGYNDIFKLISNPGKSFHCTDLMGSVLLQKGEALADDQAKKDYWNKLTDIRNELEQSELALDAHKTIELQSQYDELVEFLSKTYDKKGRARKQNDVVDKIRSAVTWRIRNAISKIEKANPPLGKHFNNTIKTGTYCEYHPEHKVEWNVE